MEQPGLPGYSFRRTCKVRRAELEEMIELKIKIWRSGIIFSNHYVHASCSPSRAALLTGRLAWKMGMQRGNIEKYQPLGLSTKYKLLPQYLKSAGYLTHAVGKEGRK